MELAVADWQRLLKVAGEFERRREPFTRGAVMDAMGVSDANARQLLFALENKDIFRYGEDEFKDITGKVLVISDLHIPYHDRLAVETALNFAEKEQPETVVLLGDILDCFKVSNFVDRNHPDGKTMKEELLEGKRFVTEIRGRFPNAKIIYLEGNHEYRLDRYLLKNAAEIYELVPSLIEASLGLKELGIEYRTDPFQIGKLWFIHGHELGGGGNPEYITNVVFRKVYDHFIVGHWHRQQEKVWKRINKTTFWGGVLGCLCEDLDYARVNQWSRGFGIIDFNERGYFKAKLYGVESGQVF